VLCFFSNASGGRNDCAWRKTSEQNSISAGPTTGAEFSLGRYVTPKDARSLFPKEMLIVGKVVSSKTDLICLLVQRDSSNEKEKEPEIINFFAVVTVDENLVQVIDIPPRVGFSFTDHFIKHAGFE